MLIIKYSSTLMLGKRKLCECHTRFFFFNRLVTHIIELHYKTEIHRNYRLLHDINLSYDIIQIGFLHLTLYIKTELNKTDFRKMTFI